MEREEKDNPASEIMAINIDDFKRMERHINYKDEDIVIIDGWEGGITPDGLIRLGCFVIGICIQGTMQVDINYKTYQLEAGDALLGLPNTIIGHSTFSPNYKIRVAVFSGAFLQNVMKMEKNTWNTALYLHKNPVAHRNNYHTPTIFSHFAPLLKAKINDEPHCYHREVIRYIFSALFCELIGYLSHEAKQEGYDDIKPEGLSQAFYVSRKFAELLAKDGGIHRSVGYYADALCYSSKHFGKLVKQGTGHTPLDLINSRAIEHIKYRLKHSDKSTKEIAEEFNFPNQSFFGKFVKKYLGVSPARYRNQHEE